MSRTPTETERANTAALAMLARRDLSRALLQQRLERKGFSRPVAERVCELCVEAGYVDDLRYGRARLESRLDRRPAGRRDALQDLRRQGLPATMSESVVEEVFDHRGGEEAVLRAALGRWCQRHGEPDDLAAAKRCFDHLMRRSFPRYLVLQALSPWLDELSE